MKTTFRTFKPSEIRDPMGRRNLIKGDIHDVSRFDIEAFIPEDDDVAHGMTPMIRFIYWLSNGEKYSMLMAGSMINESRDVTGERNGPTDSAKVQCGTGADSRTSEAPSPDRRDNVQLEEGRKTVRQDELSRGSEGGVGRRDSVHDVRVHPSEDAMATAPTYGESPDGKGEGTEQSGATVKEPEDRRVAGVYGVLPGKKNGE